MLFHTNYLSISNEDWYRTHKTKKKFRPKKNQSQTYKKRSSCCYTYPSRIILSRKFGSLLLIEHPNDTKKIIYISELKICFDTSFPQPNLQIIDSTYCLWKIEISHRLQPISSSKSFFKPLGVIHQRRPSKKIWPPLPPLSDIVRWHPPPPSSDVRPVSRKNARKRAKTQHILWSG